MTVAAPPTLSDSEAVVALNRIDWDFADASTDFLTHNYHPYPAKYIPQIPGAFIDLFTRPGDTVLDVFCGSGTTLVEAVRRGRNAIGVDANPLAALIARAKCQPLDATIRETAKKVAREAAGLVAEYYAQEEEAPRQSRLFSIRPGAPPIANLDFWFPREARDELALIKQAIDACPVERVREFLHVAFSSIVVNVSYQDSDTRYTRREKGLKPGDTLRKFQVRLAAMLAAMAEFESIPHLGLARTVEADSRCLTGIAPRSIDLAVTSPPYPNAYSYHLYHRFRMEWLGYDQPRFKLEEIGSHRKYSAKGVNGATVATFRAEMEAVLRGIAAALRRGAVCAIVVGDSIVRGEKIDNAALIREAGSKAGMKHMLTLNRNLLSGRKAFNPVIGKIRCERIVVMRLP